MARSLLFYLKSLFSFSAYISGYCPVRTIKSLLYLAPNRSYTRFAVCLLFAAWLFVFGEHSSISGLYGSSFGYFAPHFYRMVACCSNHFFVKIISYGFGVMACFSCNLTYVLPSPKYIFLILCTWVIVSILHSSLVIDLCQLQGYYMGVVPTMAFLQLWGIYCWQKWGIHLQLWPILFYNTYIPIKCGGVLWKLELLPSNITGFYNRWRGY